MTPLTLPASKKVKVTMRAQQPWNRAYDYRITFYSQNA